MPDTLPHVLACTRLALRLSEGSGACSICTAEPGAVQFHLFAVCADGEAIDTGNRICPACAALHGYHRAVALAIDSQERNLLLDVPGFLDAECAEDLREEHRHVRSLLASGRISTPPAIPLEHFVPVNRTIDNVCAAFDRIIPRAEAMKGQLQAMQARVAELEQRARHGRKA